MKKKGFFAALFDQSFSEFVTTKLIKLLYAISLGFSALLLVAAVVVLFMQSVGAGVVGLLLAPIVFVLSALMTRVWTELLIVIFRIAENSTEIVNQNKAE